MTILWSAVLLACAVQDDSSARKHEWKKVFSAIGDDLRAVSFVDATTGYILGHNGSLQRTTDGGLTWTVRRQGDRAHGARGWEHVWFKDGKQGWIAECDDCGTGGPGAMQILMTKDGGATWARNSDGSGDKLWDWSRFTSRTGETWIRDHFERVYAELPDAKSTTGARRHPSLEELNLLKPEYEDVAFADLDRGALVGGENGKPFLLVTDDGGRSWSRRAVPGLEGNAISRVSMTSLREIRILGENRTAIWASRDGGLTWTREWKGGEIAELCFPARDFGFAIGKNGLILRYAAR
jgi:photosystem II stability/assembly factor-like uncharacterized protein